MWGTAGLHVAPLGSALRCPSLSDSGEQCVVYNSFCHCYYYCLLSLCVVLVNYLYLNSLDFAFHCSPLPQGVGVREYLPGV